MIKEEDRKRSQSTLRNASVKNYGGFLSRYEMNKYDFEPSTGKKQIPKKEYY